MEGDLELEASMEVDLQGAQSTAMSGSSSRAVECTGAASGKEGERGVPGGASGAGADEVNDLELPHDDDKQLLRQERPVDGYSGDRCSSGALSSRPAHRWAWGGG